MKLNYKDFNKMTEQDLFNLKGVGRTTAKRVVGFRPFRSDDYLFKVKGLGKKTLNGFGIEKTKKKKKKWYSVDGVDYPDFALAKHKKYGHIDLFWRIPKKYRQTVREPTQWVLRMRCLDEKIRAEGPDGISSRYVDNSHMWAPGFKFDWEK